jgi:putative addiction module component
MSDPQSNIDEEWAEEIEQRCDAVDAGELPTSDWKDVRSRIEREIFGR